MSKGGKCDACTRNRVTERVAQSSVLSENACMIAGFCMPSILPTKIFSESLSARIRVNTWTVIPKCELYFGKFV